MNATELPLWRPTPARIEAANLSVFQRAIERETRLRFDTYDALWQWSIDHLEDFWLAVWRYFDVPGQRGAGPVMRGSMPCARWFEGAEINFVEQVLRHRLDTPALVWESDSCGAGSLSWDELRRQVASLAACLRQQGLQRGDRVVAYLPNVPQTIVAFLAVASIGAAWSVCAPEMGPLAVMDRFAQIEPSLLICCDGYRYGGRAFDRRAVLADLVRGLPSLRTIVWTPILDPHSDPEQILQGRRCVHWRDAVARSDAPLQIERVAFDQPLWIVYSSGTTGRPKAIVHGHGGVLLAGLVSCALHSNLGPGHRVLWVVSTGWIVWNIHLCGLLVGATVCLYEGAVTGPAAEPDWSHLWRLVARLRIQSFGGGAAYFASCMKQEVAPRECADLAALETLFATGSPLSPEAFRWIYASVKRDLWLCPISGGTDIAGGFLVGTPTLPVYEGEMQCRNLGCAVYAFDESGHAVTDAVGELVCTAPMPTMPLYLWDDPDGERLRESYFEPYRAPDGTPIWRHGDWLRLVPRPGAQGGIIYGRSDATINRGGIRMGTAEFYRAVEAVPQVIDSLVVDLEYLGRASYLALFVVLKPGRQLDAVLEAEIRQCLRVALSARHLPDEIVQADAVPRNLTGKKLELPVKKILLGHPVAKVVSRDTMANPQCLDWYIAFGVSRGMLPPRGARDAGPVALPV